MASPGNLVKVVANVLGVPEAQVVQHDRNLAIAGLRTIGGRGRSAAKMTPTDAANLLIGVAASSMVKETVEVVGDYAKLPLRDSQSPGSPDEKTSLLPGLSSLPPSHTFGEAMTALIGAASNGSLQKFRDGRPAEFITAIGQEIPKLWRINVVFWGPFAQASIQFHSSEYDTERHDYSTVPQNLDGIIAWAENAPDDQGDLRQIREFTEKTIFAIGEILKS